MPAVYDKLGIRFSYPDNWILDEQEAVSETPTVSVYSPSGAFWSVALHPPATDPAELAETALAALRGEYADAESEAVSERLGNRTIGGYDLNFFYLDLTSTALVRGFRTRRASCLVLCQAEDRDYEQLAPVFRAITASLLAAAEGPVDDR